MVLDKLLTAAQGLTEATSRDLVQQIATTAIAVPFTETPIATTYVRQGNGNPPILLLHGFDSSVMEFRRLLPWLSAKCETWAVDLLGFGFTDRLSSPRFDPEAIKLHLHSFWQQMIGRPVVLVGASMGGAAAIDFALTFPDCVAQLVLIDSAGLTSGPAIESVMVPPFDRWATAFLANPGVRRRISRQAYYDPIWVNADAECCAALHLQAPGWSKALIAFTKSGGYNRFLQPHIAHLTVPSLILWGQQDRILGTQDAHRFAASIADSQLIWLPRCGHVPHLECAELTAQHILNRVLPASTT